MSEILTLEGWGGQNCDIEIIKRDADKRQGCDPVYVRFKSGAGYLSFEMSEVRRLLKRMEAFAAS